MRIHLAVEPMELAVGNGTLQPAKISISSSRQGVKAL